MTNRTTHVIALTNQKGGCGKTTTTISLAAALALEGKRVTIIDTDPQCNATDSFGVDRDELGREGRYTLADAYLAKTPARDLELDFGDRFQEMLRIVPGHRGLGTVSHRLEVQLQTAIANGEHSEIDADDIKNEHRHRLKHSVASLRGHRDFVLIDTPPDLGFLMTTALIAADWYIVPVFPSGYDMSGLETLIRTVIKVRDRYNPRLDLLGVLMGNSDSRAKLDADIHSILRENFSDERVFNTIINRSVKHREATVNNQTIFEHASGQQAAEQFKTLALEILARLESTARDKSEPMMEANRG